MTKECKHIKELLHLQQMTVALTFKQRLMGLIGRHSLAIDEGMYFPRCKSVHTFFMRIPIRVIFFDRQGKIIKDIPVLKPWSWVYCRQAVGVLECAAIIC